MTMLDLAAANLLSAPVLCFALGWLAVALRSDLAVPEPVQVALSAYLMLSIGLRGGAELGAEPLGHMAPAVLAALALGCGIPLWCYGLLRWFLRLGNSNAAALAAHYGSVSAVTFAAVTAMLDRQGQPFEGFVAALLAVMEVPAIIVAIALARAGQAAGQPRRSSGVLAEILASKSVLLLAGGLLIGALVGKAGMAPVQPFFGGLFPGALCLFLLELGRVAARHAADFRAVGLRLAGFAVVMPVLHGAQGVGLGWLAGLSEGGAVVLGTLAASASYIAAPAAVRLALPEANPGYYLTCSLAITFPFNILLGLPLYQGLAALAYG